MNTLLLYCNVFRRLRLRHHLKTTFDRADYFRTVPLRVIFRILLWITGLKFWVVCVSTFDFLLSHHQHELRATSPSPRPWLVNGAVSDTVVLSSRQWTDLMLVIPANIWQCVSLSCSFLGFQSKNLLVLHKPLSDTLKNAMNFLHTFYSSMLVRFEKFDLGMSRHDDTRAFDQEPKTNADHSSCF